MRSRIVYDMDASAKQEMSLNRSNHKTVDALDAKIGPPSALDKSLGVLVQELEALARENDNLALAVFVVLVVRLDVALRNLRDHVDNLFRLRDALGQACIFRLEQLQQCPDGNVLERGVSAGEEAAEVAVDTARRLGPVLDKDGVIADC
jgi:hypothetical protein